MDYVLCGRGRRMKIDIILLILWIIVGICQLISCLTGADCRWLSYWLCYTMTIISLVKCIFLDND